MKSPNNLVGIPQRDLYNLMRAKNYEANTFNEPCERYRNEKIGRVQHLAGFEPTTSWSCCFRFSSSLLPSSCSAATTRKPGSTSSPTSAACWASASASASSPSSSSSGSRQKSEQSSFGLWTNRPGSNPGTRHRGNISELERIFSEPRNFEVYFFK